MVDVYSLYKRLESFPLGKRIFSIGFAQAAPYFSTVSPRVEEVAPNRAVVVVPKRRAVHNHIKTVHVIAICNGLEAAMGLLAEASVPSTHRWIPRAMDVTYPAKATTDITCTAETAPELWDGRKEVPVTVRATRADGTVVVEGTIHLYVSPK